MINGLNEYVEQASWKGYKLNHFSACKCKQFFTQLVMQH